MMIRYQIHQPLKFKANVNCYIISYQDEAIYQNLVSQIVRFHKLEEHVQLDIAQNADWPKITECTQNYALFASPKAYEIQLSKTALNCKTLPALTPLEGDVFIFKTNVFKHKLLDEIKTKTNGIWLQSYAPKNQDLWQWLSPQIQTIKLEADVKPWFLQNHHLNFSQCQQALEKIQLSESKQLSLADFQNHLGYASVDENWNPLIEAWMQGKKNQALNLLQQSKSANHELTLLVWLLGRNLQVLYSLKQSVRPAQEVFASFKIWPQQIPQFQQGLKFFTQHQLGKLIEAIHEIDVSLKSGKLTYCWLKLEKFLLES